MLLHHTSRRRRMRKQKRERERAATRTLRYTELWSWAQVSPLLLRLQLLPFVALACHLMALSFVFCSSQNSCLLMYTASCVCVQVDESAAKIIKAQSFPRLSYFLIAILFKYHLQSAVRRGREKNVSLFFLLSKRHCSSLAPAWARKTERKKKTDEIAPYEITSLLVNVKHHWQWTVCVCVSRWSSESWRRHRINQKFCVFNHSTWWAR